MKVLFLLVVLPSLALAQVQESISPILKHDKGSVQFTLSTQTVQQVVAKLDDLIEKRDATELQITQLQAQVTKLNKMIDDAKAAGVKTQDEIDAEEKAAYDAAEAIKAAKVLESAAESANK